MASAASSSFDPFIRARSNQVAQQVELAAVD
jgi:hypothetical protein